MEKVYAEAASLLKQGKSFALASIVDERGSSPRSTGSKMIIHPDGSIFATIGGGQLEFDAMHRALDVIKEKQPVHYVFSMTGEDASSADMICGGDVDILIDYIDAADPDNLAVFEAAADAESRGANAWLLILFGKGVRYLCFVEDGEITGYCPDNMKACVSQPSFGLFMHPELTEGLYVYAEPIHNAPLAYLLGAGHVSREIAQTLTQIGFATIVLDDRDEFANKDRFPDSKIVVLDSMERFPEKLMPGGGYYIVVTRGHKNDRDALEWSLRQPDPSYIGMIGSKRKNAIVMDKLREAGFPQEQLDKVYAPIGIGIGAETPAEIAISIVAEIIKVKSEKLKAERALKKDKGAGCDTSVIK